MDDLEELENLLKKMRSAESYQLADATAGTRVVIRGIECANLDALIEAATELVSIKRARGESCKQS